MRVYLPSTLPLLRAAVAAGEVGPPPLSACAVTPALREWFAVADLEELEYAALTAAAAVSLRLLAAADDAPRRRVVLAADVAASAVEPAVGERAAVRVTAVVPVERLVAVHVDDPAAEPVVRAAVDALPAAAAGDEDAEFLVAETDSHELQWYAASEIRELAG